jgi:hypothetical protein
MGRVYTGIAARRERIAIDLAPRRAVARQRGDSRSHNRLFFH